MLRFSQNFTTTSSALNIHEKGINMMKYLANNENEKLLLVNFDKSFFFHLSKFGQVKYISDKWNFKSLAHWTSGLKS